MKVVCKYNNGNDIDPNLLPLGFNSESETNLILEKEYIVLGIMLYEKSIFYLLDEDLNPFWYPDILFSISESKINSNWHFKMITKQESPYAQAIWGYLELCFLKGHNDRLMERDSNDMQIYFRQKKAAEAE